MSIATTPTRMHYTTLATGSRQQREMAMARQARRDDYEDGSVPFLAGGPLDAPDLMAGGSVLTTGYSDWRRRPLASQSECIR